MTDEKRRNDMAETLAHEVRDARFARSYASAMAHFGGRAVPDAKERLTAWRHAAPSPFRASADRPAPAGDHEAGGISDEPPLPSWTGVHRG